MPGMSAILNALRASACTPNEIARNVLKTRCLNYGPFPSLEPRRVVITGLGLVTPLGNDVGTTWSRLINGECAIRRLQEIDLPEEQRCAFESLTCKIAAPVDHVAFSANCREHGLKHVLGHPKYVQYAMLAAREAIQEAGLSGAETSPLDRAGVAIGCGMSATAELAKAGQIIGAGNARKLSPHLVPRVLANMAAGLVSMEHNLWGPNHSVSTACTTGAHAIGDAFNFIRLGQAEAMVAGGTESCIDAVSIGGFSRMRALETSSNDQPEAASRPFDCSRNGFVMGEGAGIMVLESYQHARERGANIIAEVRGYGLSGDAHHIAQPPNDGRGAYQAMTNALQNAGVPSQDVAYLNAHATSTPQGDAAEALAIQRLFCAANDSPRGALKVSSTKGATGHLLGAAGSVEAIFSVLALRHGLAPPTLNLTKEEPEILGKILVKNASETLELPVKAVMSNSFGFGGTNASLVFTCPPPT